MNAPLPPPPLDRDVLVASMLDLFQKGDVVAARRLATDVLGFDAGDALWRDLFGPWNPDDGET